MDKKFKFIDQKGREISKEEAHKAMSCMFYTPKIVPPSVCPPKDYSEFECRLMELYCYFQEKFFGLKQEITSTKTLKSDRGHKAIVDALFDLERHIEQRGIIFETIVEGYAFLKMVLESDAPLFGKDFYLLGLHRDRSGITKTRQNQISVQCAAQILWRLNGNCIPTIEAMTQELLEKGSPLYKFLELVRFQNRRTIQDWVRPMFPIPADQRKERRHRHQVDGDFDISMTIPGIFTERGVSFPRLRFALICLTRLLRTLGWEKSQIIASPFVRQLSEPIQWYPRLYVEDWICEAHSGNGSIFAS